MPEWLFGGLVTAAVGIVGTAGIVIGYFVSAKTARTTAATQAASQVEIAKQTAATTAAVAEKSNEQQLIDQLQEELKDHRAEQGDRTARLEERIQKVDDRNHELMQEREAYRNHAHELRSHIWDGKPPPPPNWPEGLPR